MPLHNREELHKARFTYAASLERQKVKILVCSGTGCVAGGSLEIRERLICLLRERNIACTVSLEEEPHEDSVGVKQSGCHGFCEIGPLLRIEPQGWLYIRVKPEDCAEIVDKTIVMGEHIPRLAYSSNGDLFRRQDDIPFYNRQIRLVLAHCGHIDAYSIKESLAIGGYSAFEKALFDMSADAVIEEISSSSLRGRGGGGFPTGRKWSQVRRQKTTPKYIVCNGDEGDPGAFMDCSIMEGDPHRMLEGMLIAGLATGASEGYIYVRAEYPLAVKRLQTAIRQASEFGLLGKNILGSGFAFNIRINRGAGAFVCGEGSALTASIEGKRGMPRVKPPRTVEQGLFAKPTVLNNVETFANVPLIIMEGANRYKDIGTGNSPGTKAFSLTGNIVNTGLIEVPMGTTLGEVIFDIGGGIRANAEFKAVQIGGPSGGCLTKEHLSLPLDFDSLKKVGAMIGSGGLVVMDSNTCMVEVARFFMNFTRNESCGKCVPCREGTKRMLNILEDIVAGKGKKGDIELLLELADTISATSLCGLGKSATSPVVSTIRYFRDEYEEHIFNKRCPTGTCLKLKVLRIDPELCKGCSLCVRVCPAGAITGKKKQPHTLDSNLCLRCDACVSACPAHAVVE
ncbi:MAG: 4Fe-4S binding protein [Desulfovibrio sp.]|jgi:NADH-quinone oxidoreductase subunit F|nr:4Fe-4S binding protein [Desulfovibrio sp.]